MPIEFWWWIEPMFNTGFVTLFVCAIIAVLIEKAFPYNSVSMFFAVLTIVPWLISALSVAVWLLVNVLILIWR